MTSQRYLYSTRDLLMMAAMAALGGVASTYINFIGDFFQSFLGFAGTTQWAAGFHVLWLILAVGLTRKPGAGTITGIIKGGVELFTGNTHGLLVVLVDIVAGLLVDLGLLPFRKRESWFGYAVAGGVASASNVFVFQLFAAIPADILSYGVIGLIALIAFFSGVVFAGILGYALLVSLRRSGAVKDQPSRTKTRNVPGVILLGGLLLAVSVFGYLKIARTGAGSIEINGAVSAPYQFNPESSAIAEQTVEVEQGGSVASYRGYPLGEIIDRAQPEEGSDFLLLRGSDGYVFFITRGELSSNSSILVQPQGQGANRVYNLVGPQTKKAWVNGVVEITLVNAEPLPLLVDGNTRYFNPSDWVEEMDSTRLDVGNGLKKYQGVPMALLFEEFLAEGSYAEFLIPGGEDEQVRLDADQVRQEDGIRVFIILDGEEVAYAAAHLNGEVYLADIQEISLQ